MNDQQEWEKRVQHGWEKRVKFSGCKLDGDTFKVILKVPIVKSKSVFVRVCNSISALLIRWAAKISGYTVYYEMEFSYKEREDIAGEEFKIKG